MEINIDLVDDLIELFWIEIDKLKNNGFIFQTYDQWKIDAEKQIRAEIKRKMDNDEDVSKEKEKLLETNLEEKYRLDQVYIYSNLRQRIPESKKRKIKYSSIFNCPKKYQHGLNNLINKIKNGESLFPHLSRQIFNPKAQDGMLFDFGISHLHLGINPDVRLPLLVKGNKEILYCIINDDITYFLVIDDHGRWADIELMKIIKKDFPQLLNKWKLKNVLSLEKDINENERKTLRYYGISAPIEIDGNIYMSPGGGINTAGGSVFSVIKMQNYFRYYRNLQKQIYSILDSNMENLDDGYVRITNELNFKMIDYEKIVLKDEKYEIILNVNINNITKLVESIDLIK